MIFRPFNVFVAHLKLEFSIAAYFGLNHCVIKQVENIFCEYWIVVARVEIKIWIAVPYGDCEERCIQSLRSSSQSTTGLTMFTVSRQQLTPFEEKIGNVRVRVRQIIYRIRNVFADVAALGARPHDLAFDTLVVDPARHIAHLVRHEGNGVEPLGCWACGLESDTAGPLGKTRCE